MDWVNGNPIYFNIDKEVLEQLYNDIQNSEMLFDEIAEKYDLSRRTITRINQGHTHFSKDKDYPLRKRPEVQSSQYCLDCGVRITNGASRCKNCHDKHQRVVDRPTREELKILIRNFTFVALGKRYGVSDNAIRKWCKQYNLPHKTSEIKKISDSEWMEM